VIRPPDLEDVIGLTALAMLVLWVCWRGMGLP